MRNILLHSNRALTILFRPFAKNCWYFVPTEIANLENEKKGKDISEPTAQPDSPNANALTKKAARNPESIADGGRTYGPTDGRADAGRVPRARASRNDKANDKTRENWQRKVRCYRLYSREIVDAH